LVFENKDSFGSAATGEIDDAFSLLGTLDGSFHGGRGGGGDGNYPIKREAVVEANVDEFGSISHSPFLVR
jgi:hypothetical protein